jgi:carbonic anhydrase
MKNYSIIEVDKPEDIFMEYRKSPVEELLLYHNLSMPLPVTTRHAHMLVSMCMDHRKELTVPNEFAYVLRSAGGNLRDSDFEISYSIAVGGISCIALLAHTDCGMVDVIHKRNKFIEGLTNRAGWSKEAASSHFDNYANLYQITDSVIFTLTETERLRQLYPAILIAPLLYDVKTDRLSQIVI